MSSNTSIVFFPNQAARPSTIVILCRPLLRFTRSFLWSVDVLDTITLPKTWQQNALNGTIETFIFQTFPYSDTEVSREVNSPFHIMIMLQSFLYFINIILQQQNQLPHHSLTWHLCCSSLFRVNRRRTKRRWL